MGYMLEKKPLLKTLMLGVLAGVSIAFGGLFYILCSSKGYSLLGSLLFSMGLLLVCVFALYLYTGKIGFIIDSDNKKKYSLNLLIGIIGNLIGAIGFGYLMFIFFKDNKAITDTALSVANKRMITGDNFYITMIGSFFCGVLVYLAVYTFKKDFPLWLRVFILILCVFLFVGSGFEHCIANAFYISIANKWCPETLLNMAISIVFNSLGSIVLAFAIKLVLDKKH